MTKELMPLYRNTKSSVVAHFDVVSVLKQVYAVWVVIIQLNQVFPSEIHFGCAPDHMQFLSCLKKAEALNTNVMM